MKKILLLLSVVFVASCSNETEVKQEKEVFSRLLPNPFDYLGVHHNNFMASIRYDQNVTNFDEVFNSAIEYTVNNDLDINNIDVGQIKDIVLNNRIESFSSSDVDFVSTKLGLNSIEYNGLKRISIILNDTDYERPIDMLTDIENLETAFTELEESESKDFLLTNISILKHSTNYWLDFYNIDRYEAGTEYVYVATAKRRNWFGRIFGGAVWDFGGAVLGSVGGPVGSLIGAAIASGTLQLIESANEGMN